MDMGRKVKHLSSICGRCSGADRSEQVVQANPPQTQLGPSLVINLITQKAHQMQQKAISSGGASASSPAILIPPAMSLGFPFRSAAQY